MYGTPWRPTPASVTRWFSPTLSVSSSPASSRYLRIVPYASARLDELVDVGVIRNRVTHRLVICSSAAPAQLFT